MRSSTLADDIQPVSSTLKVEKDILGDVGSAKVEVLKQWRSMAGVLYDTTVGHCSVLQDQSHQARYFYHTTAQH